MACCGNSAKSKALTGRVYSPETLALMREAAIQRLRPVSTGQDWRRTPEYRKWETEVKGLWNNECAITGEKRNTVMHHFFSGARNNQNLMIRDKLLHHPHNGIVITQAIHTDFHDKFGYQRNNLKQFQIYVYEIYKPISSQAKHLSLEGSETRRYDLQRIRRLQERLEETKLELAKALPPSLAQLL